MSQYRNPLQPLSIRRQNSNFSSNAFKPTNANKKTSYNDSYRHQSEQFEEETRDSQGQENDYSNTDTSSILFTRGNDFYSNKTPKRIQIPVDSMKPAPRVKAHQYQSNFSSSSSSLIEESEFVSNAKMISVKNNLYLAVQKIGKGGSSKVYKVLSADGQVYALKVVNLSNAGAEAVESFVNEIHLLTMLQGSERIINLVDSDIDKDNKRISIVLELGDIDLRSLIEKNRTSEMMVNPHFLRHIWQQMLEAVQIVHKAHVVHGDLKPANFLFVKGTLKLIDFGIAKTIDSANTTNIERTSTAGTLNYMSPEALMRNKEKGTYKCGRAADVWSLGCILYQLVYNRPPFPQTDILLKMKDITDPNYQIQFDEIENRPDFEDLYDVMYQCLQRDPKKRPTIEELLVHPYITTVHTVLEEQVAEKLLSFINFIQDCDYSVNEDPEFDNAIMTQFAKIFIDKNQDAEDVEKLAMMICKNLM